MNKSLSISTLTALLTVFVTFLFDAQIGIFFRKIIPDAAHIHTFELSSDWGLWLFYAIFAGLIVYALFKKDKNLRGVCLAYLKAQLIFSFAVVRLMKILFGRARPEYGMEFTFFSVDDHYNSFPSGHSADAFVSGVFLFYLLRHSRYRVVPLGYALLIALLRITVSAHHPSDVVAGMAIGILGACLILSRLATVPNKETCRADNARPLRHKIEMVMTRGDVTDPAFTTPFEWLLYVCSQVYRLAVKCRISLYEMGVLRSKGLPCKVISIGNITVGGAGKTPVAMYMANLVRRIGYQVAVISRGYGGSAEKNGGIVSDGQTIRMGPEEAGDEAHLMSLKLQGIPVVVGKDRVQAGRLAIREFGSDVLVLDDAFQHLRLRRDLNLLLFDASNALGNGHLIPRGVLREPLSHVKRADAFIITRSEMNATATTGVSFVQQVAGGRPIFGCTRAPDHLVVNEDSKTYALDFLRGRRLLAFSGIARNEDFQQMIINLGGDIVKFISFPDHHCYSDDDLKSIAASGERLGAEFLITTEKDYVRVRQRLPGPLKLLVLTVAISFGVDTEPLENYIKKLLTTP